MANETKAVSGQAAVSPEAARIAKMHKSRAIRSAKIGELDAQQRQCLKIIISAKQTLELAEQLVINGKSLPIEVVQACGSLQSASAAMLYV
jgi:hypothetical protein